MNFELATTYFCTAALSPRYVWYAVDVDLHRLDLETLERECVRTFPDIINSVLTSDTSDSCVVMLLMAPLPAWRFTDGEWTAVFDVPKEFKRRRRDERFHVRNRKIDNLTRLVLVDRRRTAERAQRLIKDEALAARVCHYL